MRGRYRAGIAVVTVTLMAACGGDAGEAPEEAPVEQETPADAAPQVGGQQAVNLPEGVTQEQYDQGRQLFTGQGGCHACHGPQATGTQLAPDLTDSEWLNISGRNHDEIVELIKTGVPEPVEHPAPMPPMGGASLTEEQVQALAAYVMALGE